MSDCCSCSCKQENTVSYCCTAVNSTWTFRDYAGSVLVRFSNSFRMKYRVEPGLYSIGIVDSSSPVFVTANYKLSFDIVRKNLEGINAYILVLDTKGINVWCAAGKGSFGTNELLKKIVETELFNVVKHRNLVVPQLGAPGVNSNRILKESGFRVTFGPVRAQDIPAYVSSGYKVTKEMRIVKFNIVDRLTLIPIEIRHALKVVLPVILLIGLALCFNSRGFAFNTVLSKWSPFIYAFGAALAGGTILAPLFLPWIPFRSFCLKGFIVGLICTLPFVTPGGTPLILKALFSLLITGLSSYFAFNFTGSTTFTNPSGVKKEFSIAMPLYGIAAVMSIALFVIYRIQTWSF